MSFGLRLMEAEKDLFLRRGGGGDGGIESIDDGRDQLEVADDGGGEARGEGRGGRGGGGDGGMESIGDGRDQLEVADDGGGEARVEGSVGGEGGAESPLAALD